MGGSLFFCIPLSRLMKTLLMGKVGETQVCIGNGKRERGLSGLG